MNLTKGEKLLLIMLCDLYKQLSIKSDIDPNIVKNAIIKDQSWGIELHYPELFAPEKGPMPPIVKEVRDVLEMWAFIKESYANLSKDEQKEVKNAVGDELPILGNAVQFPGFDLDNEPEHYEAAKFFIEQLGLYPMLKGDYLHACGPVLDSHRRMLGVFVPLRMDVSGRFFNPAELVQLLSLRVVEEDEDKKPRAVAG
jgi:uncharacterized protein YfbU (UPF0304 family)